MKMLSVPFIREQMENSPVPHTAAAREHNGCTTPTHPHPLQWRHNEHDGISNQRRLFCLHNRLFMRRSKKTSKLRVTGLCAGNSPVTGEFPAQTASSAENVSIWWYHHAPLPFEGDNSCTTKWLRIKVILEKSLHKIHLLVWVVMCAN